MAAAGVAGPLIRYEDGFLLPRMAPAWHRELAIRGLPAPKRDRARRLWIWGDEGEAAVRFLHEALGVAVDDAVEERLGAPDERGRLRALLARLRPYQKDGVHFLATRRRAMLADGMGLGKTVQALAALEQLQAFPAIVLAPASVKLGWEAEVVRFMPWRSVQVLWSGQDRLRDVDLYVLNPELLPRHIEDLYVSGPRSVVLDEAHVYKNPRAQRSQLAEDLLDEVDVRFALTGTPIPNRRNDLLQQLHLLGRLEETLGIYRGLLPHYWRPGQPIRHDQAMRVLERLPRRELHERLRTTCMLRRTKDEVQEELPPFHRTHRDLVLADASPYLRQEQGFIEWVRAKRRGDDGSWRAEDRLEGRHRLSLLRKEAALAKIPAVVEWGEGLEDERVIYFAHHRQVARALHGALPGNHGLITGEVAPKARQAIVDGLGATRGLVATMDASGQGVDGMQLHARHVVFIELDWTPTKHEQCEGRLHRIGQQDRVEAWYFTARDTIDAAMMRRLDEKWRDVAGIVEGDAEADRFVTAVMDRAARRADLWA